MSRAKIISAALVAGIAATGAQAAQSSDDHLIATAPGPSDDMLIGQDFEHDFEMNGDILLPSSAVHPDDDPEVRIDYAQTYWGGESNDAVQGVTGTAKPKKKQNQSITLDNGIKKKGKLKNQQGRGNKKKKTN